MEKDKSDEKHGVSVTEGANVAVLSGMTADKPGATTKVVYNVSTCLDYIPVQLSDHV